MNILIESSCDDLEITEPLYRIIYKLNRFGKYSMHRVCEDGAIENYRFYIDDDGMLYSDHNALILSDEPGHMRLIADDWQHQKTTFGEIATELKLGGWSEGWANVPAAR